MWHKVDSVAEHRRVADPGALVAFATQHSALYGIIQDPEARVSTWHVDKLVADFFAGGGVRLSGEEWLRRLNRDVTLT